MCRMLVMCFAAFAGLSGWTDAPGGQGLELSGPSQSAPGMPALTSPIAPSEGAAPDVLLSAATLAVTAYLKQHRNPQSNISGQIAALIESTILPPFEFRAMTRLAVARNWRLASSEQQDALVAEFRTLLVRSYAAALANYRDQLIEYRPLRMAPGQTEVTIKSNVKQPGAEWTSIDYAMEKTTAGWKVYDIRIGGISLITTYRSTFADVVRDRGVDGLIKALASKNRQADAGLRSNESGARSALFSYALMTSILRGRQ